MQPADAPEIFARWPFPPGVRGMRCAVHRPGLVEALDDGRMDRVFAAAEEHDVPLMMLLPNSKLHKLDEAARRHPGLKLIVDHLGLFFSGDDKLEALKNLLPLAQRPNIAVKASNLPAYAPTEEGYPFRSVQPLVREAVSAFGAQRVFWGTDMTGMRCSYRQGVTMVTEEMSFLSSSDLEWVMGRGLCEWLGWNRA